MLLLTVSNISKRFDDQIIIEDGSLGVNEGDKIGLVGRNGTGKTTLFNIIHGDFQPDSGTIDYKKGIKIGTVAQELDGYQDLSLYEFCFLAHPEVNDIRLQMAKLEPQVTGDNPPPEMVNEYHLLTQRYDEMGGYTLEREVRLVLEGIGFQRRQMDRPLGSLSGGERNRAQIAAALLGDYDLLLLDEPTNHLDIQATIWLETHIASSPKAYLIVSHDRRFLQNTVTKIAELSLGRLELFHCRYEAYLVERDERRRLAEHHFRHQAEEIARIEDFIRRNLAGQKTKQAQSKQKYLARLKRLERPRIEKEQPTFHIKDGGRSFREVVKVDDLSIGYDGMPLVEGITFELYRGDRVGLVGPNGCGKTTLLKTLGGLLEPVSGDITVGGNVDVAYFDQELSNLDFRSDVISELWEVDSLAESGRLRSFLARFGFSGEDVFKKVAMLSGGEKTKLALSKLLYHPANVMIFDEPTNHLDIASIEALEEGLAGYNGTLLIVSHDRYFLDRVVNRILEIDRRRLNSYLGNYSDYVGRKMQQPTAKREVSEEKKNSYEQFKEESRRKSRHRKRLIQVTETIAELETKLKKLEQDELVVEASDWQRLNELAARRREAEEKLLRLYIEKEEMEQSSPDE
ncbi:MAG: ABC-F family ATP-binding cassette domain-containing protein [candidate division Zixibacteria bacterium]|nr:ABC-F family ATP-binding cassette domain-containing protein [candidate division Zixibacteria bacterium]